eukprot:8591786-Alexandrium_andersonii.AAC.1
MCPAAALWSAAARRSRPALLRCWRLAAARHLWPAAAQRPPAAAWSARRRARRASPPSSPAASSPVASVASCPPRERGRP